MNIDQPAKPRSHMEAMLKRELNLFRLRVRPHRLRLTCSIPTSDDAATSLATRNVLFLFSNDSSVDSEWSVFAFPQVHVDIVSQDDDEFDAIQPDQEGFRELGHIDADQSYFAAQFVIPARQFEVLASLAASRPAAEIQLHLHCREPLETWDGRQRLHIVHTKIESWIDVADDVPECAFRDLVNQEPRVALFEDIIEIAHVPEIRNMIRTVQFSAALLVVILILLVWLGFSGTN